MHTHSEHTPQSKRQSASNSAVQRKDQSSSAFYLQDNRNPAPLQRKNNTGLPNNLKAGIESLSGHSMDDVKVHFNSPKPAQLHAHAYAQGTNIHIGPGQERHLPHEAWHIAQQKQGRVRPTMQLQGGIKVNDDTGLEKEADVMGARALQMKSAHSHTDQNQDSIQFYPMDDMGFEGIDYAVMSLKAYEGWQETIQARMGLNGTAMMEDQVIVTQFNSSSDVHQMFLGHKAKGGLLIAEGLLTAAAGGAGIALSGGVGLVPGILAIGIGVVKMVRGAITIYAGDKPSGKQLAILDTLRAIEALTALVGGALAGHIPAIIFGIAKLFRSLITMLTDWMGKKGKSPTGRKVLMGISAALHAVEVGAGIAGGIGAFGKADHASSLAEQASTTAETATHTLDANLHITTGALTIVTAGSKLVRTADQAHGAYKAPRTAAPVAAPIVAQAPGQGPAPGYGAVAHAPVVPARGAGQGARGARIVHVRPVLNPPVQGGAVAPRGGQPILAPAVLQQPAAPAVVPARAAGVQHQALVLAPQAPDPARRQWAIRILELPPNFNQNMITKQYRRLALQEHSDKGNADDHNMQEINAARDILTGRHQPSHGGAITM